MAAITNIAIKTKAHRDTVVALCFVDGEACPQATEVAEIVVAVPIRILHPDGTTNSNPKPSKKVLTARSRHPVSISPNPPKLQLSKSLTLSSAQMTMQY